MFSHGLGERAWPSGKSVKRFVVRGLLPHANLLFFSANHAHINSIHFTDPSPAIAVTLAQKTADAAVLAKITGAYVLDVHNPNGSWTTTGHGNNLTIHDIKGVAGDTITGGGSGEDFVFGAGFGNATLVDFHSHLTGLTHDTVTLARSEFGSFTGLLHDATQSGTSVLISSGSDHLTLQGITLSQLVSTDFKFV
jgi:hypothetical protein